MLQHFVRIKLFERLATYPPVETGLGISLDLPITLDPHHTINIGGVGGQVGLGSMLDLFHIPLSL